MASPTAPKSVPAQQPIHTTPQDNEKMMTHRRPPAYPHGMVDNFNQQYQQQQFDSSHYEGQQPNMEEKEHPQKQQAMWHQDSASSIFSDQAGGANLSGPISTGVQEPQGRGGTNYSGLSPGSQESQGRPCVVDLMRDSAGSLGISLYRGEGPGGGVYIMNLSPACQAVAKGRLNPRDRILEVRNVLDRT